MNCSSESTVQNNSYKLSNSQVAKQTPQVSTLESKNTKHFRKRSEATYNFFLNKHSPNFNPKTCKSNNISFQNNDSSINASVRRQEKDQKLTKLEKYFKKLSLGGGPPKPLRNEASLKNLSMKNAGTFNNIYNNEHRKGVSSPKGNKSGLAFQINSSLNNSKINEKRSKPPSHAKSLANLNQINLAPLFAVEELVYEFTAHILLGEDIYDIFTKYIDLVQENDFEIYILMLPSPSLAEEFKNALIIERMTLMICFYFVINNLYQKEKFFLKKLTVLVFSNIQLLMQNILSSLTSAQVAVS